MKNYILLLFIFFSLLSCNKKQTVESNLDSNEKNEISYSDLQLEKFLDSVGNLPTNQLMDKVAFKSDSIFKNKIQIDKVISNSDFSKLKKAIQLNQIKFSEAMNIFSKEDIEVYQKSDTIPLTFFSFDNNKNDYNEFAISLGNPDLDWSCELYFFKSNKLISNHKINHRYGLELKHFKDGDGKAVVYYKENYQSGSGIWWYNYYFYKYYDNNLIPILNELENTCLEFPWSIRVLWFESFVEKTNPLTLKMVFNQAFSDSIVSKKFVEDSTFVQYNWDEKSKTMIGDYKKSKITKPQILSYYIEENELLFINSHYEILKQNLKDKNLRIHTFNYLTQVKEYYESKDKDEKINKI